ncbi:MAG: cupin domain-containing protein [Acidimicrobiales bacterium]
MTQASEPARGDSALRVELPALTGGWSVEGADLRASLVVLEPGQELAAHVNREADVLLAGVAGRGEVEVDGRAHALGPLVLVHIPKGTSRRLRAAVDEELKLLVVHRRTARSGSWRWRPRRRKPWEDPWEEIETDRPG